MLYSLWISYGMPIARILVISLSVMVLLFSSACTRKAPPKDFTELYRMIDEEQYDRALNKCDELIERYPEFENLKVVRTSIYTSQAGLSLWDFKDFALTYLEKKEIPQRGGDSSLLHILKGLQGAGFDLSEKTSSSLSQLIEGLELIDKERRRLSLLPEFSPEQYAHLNQGLGYLRGKSLNRRENLLYRVILEMLDLRYQLSQNSYFLNSQDLFKVTCASHVEKITDGISLSLDQLLRIADDLEIVLFSEVRDSEKSEKSYQEFASFKKRLLQQRSQLSQWKGYLSQGMALLGNFLPQSEDKRCR